MAEHLDQSMVDRQRQARALQLVEEALELPVAERESHLTVAAGDDAALLSVALRLLNACRQAEGDSAFLGEPAGAFAEQLVREVDRDKHQLDDNTLSAVRSELAGRYEFGRELGRGGTAEVYLAKDLKHGRDVAIKIIREALTVEAQRRRFLQEIAIVARLRHPYIVPLIDSGEASGALYYVMALVEGESLRQRLDREGALPAEDVLAITRDVAEALDYAHASGFVHRDIKPQNILLGNGHALVTDFGIALAFESTLGPRASEPGMAVGTPTYMSPEQATASGRIDGRSDVYSLGCVVYEMLTGEVPYGGATPHAVIAKHLSAPVPDVSILRPWAKGGLNEVLQRALAKSPADRFATPGAFSQALATAAPTPAPRVWRRWIAVAVLLVALGAGLVSRAIAPSLRASSDTLRPDTTTIAIFPLQLAGSDTALQQAVSTAVNDAVARWSGVRVVDPMLIREYPTAGTWDVGPASRFVRSLGAGRFFWGDMSRDGESLRVHLRLSDVAAGGLLGTDRIVRLPLTREPMDSIIAAAVGRMLINRDDSRWRFDYAASRSLPAQQSFAAAAKYFARWQLDSAGSALERAASFDQEFGQAQLWLALTRVWSKQEPARYSVAAVQASLHSQGMSAREREMARAVLLESRDDLGAACKAWRGLAVADSADFAGWYGAARCHERDPVVVRDRHSPSGWRFRSSYQQALREYQQAFRLHPAILGSLRDRSYEPLRAMLFAAATSYRRGASEAPDTTTFYARISAAGDSVLFVPEPTPDAIQRAFSDAEVRAITRQREAMRDITANWISAARQSAEARRAFAIAIAVLGDAGARDTLRSAVRLTVDADERQRLALTMVWLDLAFGVSEEDLASLRRARSVADSLLAQERPEDTKEPKQMAALATLVGRPTLAAQYLRRTEVGRDAYAPVPILADGPALLTYAASGGPADSVTRLMQRVEAATRRSSDADEKREIRRWLVRAATLCFPVCSVESYDDFRAEDYLLDVQMHVTRHELPKVREKIAAIAAVRRSVFPEDITYDALAPEAELLFGIGDYQAAADWLATPMEHASRMSLARLADPVAVAGLLRSMRVYAAAVDKLGDTSRAARWRAAVAVFAPASAANGGMDQSR